MATLAFWAQHRNSAGDDAREAQQDMERNDRQKYGRCSTAPFSQRPQIQPFLSRSGLQLRSCSAQVHLKFKADAFGFLQDCDHAE
jgi:hypothetical protein